MASVTSVTSGKPEPSGSEPGGMSARPRLGYLLRQAAAAHRLAMERALADVEVTPPQFLVLRLLSVHVGSSNAELARMAALTTPTVSVIVGNLTRRGALTSRPHAVHGRVRHLDLTADGAALLAACQQRAGLVEAELEADLAPGDAAAIARWLVRLAGLSGQRGGEPPAVKATEAVKPRGRTTTPTAPPPAAPARRRKPQTAP